MSLRRRDVAALALAGLAVVSGLTAWANGDVELGLMLGTDEEGYVRVIHVAPGSIAQHNGFREGLVITMLETSDGVAVDSQHSVPIPEEMGGGEIQLPSEAVSVDQVLWMEAGFLDEANGEIYPGEAFMDRYSWFARLEGAGLLLVAGIALGLGLAWVADQGRLGPAFRREGVVLGAAAAIPLLASPLMYVGIPPIGMAGLGLVAAGSLPLARSMAHLHPGDRWPDTLFGASALVAITAVLAASGDVLGTTRGWGDRWDVGLLLATATLLPAGAAAFAVDRSGAARFRLLVPAGAVAATVLTVTSFHPTLFWLVAWLILALFWPWAWSMARGAAASVRGRRSRDLAVHVPTPAAEQPDTPAHRIRGVRVRDLAALAITLPAFGFALVVGYEPAIWIVGLALGVVSALALRRGLLGAAWKEAAVPIGCALAIPIFGAGFSEGPWGSGGAAAGSFAALGALPVADLLAARHPDAGWRRTLFLISAGMTVAAIVAVLGFPVPAPDFPGSGAAWRYLLMGFIAVVPGLVVAFSRHPDAAPRLTDRLDTLALSLTPGAAMTLLVHPIGAAMLAAWIVLLVAWRRFTIAPLLGLAARSQRERDLAVAAVEAERARLAADLHDDALQELSALVRRLDAAGDAEGAELARGVAERLRTITSDLRLPLLDDLGAGPALEWLVGRIRPLADGEVVLERADALRPPAGVELAVFRVAQEALANAVKHGRPPIRVRYRVEEDGGVSLSVDDAGPGIEAVAAAEALQAGHLGMANMQQRAEQIGALLDIRRWPAGGTHVALEWRPR